MNLWFDGGAWTCLWGVGVIQRLVEKRPEWLTEYRRVGGYSAGGWLAMMVHIGETREAIMWATLDHDFHRFGRYHRWAEETARRTWALDSRGVLQSASRLSLHTTHVATRQTIVRQAWSSLEEFVPFAAASCHVPIMSGGITYPLGGLGGCIDGGALRLNPHPEWEPDTLVISPWRFSCPHMIGPSWPVDRHLVYRPDIPSMRRALDQGYGDAERWLRKFG